MQRARVPAVLLAISLAAAGCNEWVPLGAEPEIDPLDSALRICRDWAERGGRRGPVFPGREERVDPGTYQRLFHECMRARGWVLRRKQRAPEPAGPTSSDGATQ
jgi:hypothetical protein